MYRIEFDMFANMNAKVASNKVKGQCYEDWINFRYTWK